MADRRGPLGFAAMALAGMAGSMPALAQHPLTGFVEYQTTYKVQKPYDLPLEHRFSESEGVYTTKIYPNDKSFQQGNTTEPRTEMRWETWKDQTTDNLFAADVMYESGCARTCIMQVKSNTAGEPVYLRVLDGGDLMWLGAGPTILRDYYGKWFNLKAAFNPATRTAKVWINDELKHTHRYNNARDWYFKNGTYTVEGAGPAVAHFKNVKHYLYDPKRAGETSVRLRLDAAGGGTARRITVVQGVGPSGSRAFASLFDLKGKTVPPAALAGGPAQGAYLCPPP